MKRFEVLKKLACAYLAAVVALVFSACADHPSAQSVYELKYNVEPAIGQQVDFYTDLQRSYFADVATSAKNYAKGTSENSRPLPIRLSWEGNWSEQYYVELSTDVDFTDAKVFVTSAQSIEIYNLFSGTDYYWKVAPTRADLESAEISAFSTARGIRNIYIDGVSNVRDFGGKFTQDGYYIRQGLLYRGGRFNSSNTEEFEFEITEKGIDTLVDDLKVRTEIDLRGETATEHGMMADDKIPQVKYLHIPFTYHDSLLTYNYEGIKEVFSYLADEDNYPIYFHCSIGTDRTGMIAFLLGAYLGLDEQQLNRDYLFSNFGNIGSSRTLADSADYRTPISKLSGSGWAQKVESFLLSIGVTKGELEAIKDILLE